MLIPAPSRDDACMCNFFLTRFLKKENTLLLLLFISKQQNEETDFIKLYFTDF